MDLSTQTTLCRSIRACGLPKAVSLELLNTISKWDRNNGAQWTVDRLKAYKQWYETCLAGKPEPPAYFRKTDDGYPTGIFGKLFKLRNHAKVLAVLSAGTIYTAKELTPPQREKFTKALAGDQNQHRVDEGDKSELFLASTLRQRKSWRTHFVPDVVPVTPEDMTGSSIPLVGGKTIRLPQDPYNRVHTAALALIASWKSVPQPVIEYLDRLDHLDWIPDNLSDLVGAPKYRHVNYPIGRIGLIQEPALKLRSVANPNRVAQAFTKPLAQFWEGCMREFPSDFTFDQDAGVRWVQGKLTKGIELSGSDLSSATDLLDLDCCLQLAKQWCLPYLKTDDPDQLDRYHEAVEYFRNLSRGDWETPKSSGLGRVTWKQGQPLGLYPSFRLLAITNNSLGVLAALEAHLDPWDSFAVIGDDIIMDSRMEEAYIRRVEAIGGSINRSKTIRSNQVAEFAGRVIEPNRVMLKTIKFKEPSDQSFMQIVSDLGPQARSILANRQRKMWDTFKYVPGIVYDGPWSKDSHGEPLATRVAWTELTSLVNEVPSRDPELVSLEQTLIRATMEEAQSTKTSTEEVLKDLPWPIEEDIQSTLISGRGKPSGDPRRIDGLSTLERLEGIQSQPGFRKYPKFKAEESASTLETSSPAPLTAQPAFNTVPPIDSVDEEEDREDGDKPDIPITATGGVQQTGEPPKGLAESKEGSKPPLVGTARTPLMQRVFDLVASRDKSNTHLEDESPSKS